MSCHDGIIARMQVSNSKKNLMDLHWKLRVSATFCRFTQNELLTTFVLLEVNPPINRNKLLVQNIIGRKFVDNRMVKEKSTFKNVTTFLKIVIIFFLLPHTCTLT